MSILAAAVELSQRQNIMSYLAILLGLVGIAGGAMAGVWNPRLIRGRARLPSEFPLTRLIIIMLLGALAWLATPALYLLYVQSVEGRSINLNNPQPRDMAFLSTGPGLIALAVLGLGAMSLRRAVPMRLGYSWPYVPAGLVMGVGWLLVAWPFVFGSLLLLQWVYKLVGYESPGAHELLTRMSDASGSISQILMIAGALVVAPLWEELFFRGFLQSVLRRVLDRPWLVVMISSALFASIHELWSAPAIFVLAVALGYAYERTGNLWVPICMHVLFNAWNVAFILWAQ